MAISPLSTTDKFNKREWNRQNQRVMTYHTQGIDSRIRPPADAERRASCERDFKAFCRTYFPELFWLEWSHDHHIVCSKIENAVLHGGLFAMAMPRGCGKTTLCECAGLWAMVYGHRQFVQLIGASEDAALEMLNSIKMELECNELLCEDFPEVCEPFRALEGQARRCAGQHYNGVRTHIESHKKHVVCATLDWEHARANGVVVRTAGITGRIRGAKFKRADGQSARPDLVILDDPQTDESARSTSQCEQREKTLAGAVLGLAGPGKKIAGILPCTVIQPDDMADRILNRDKHPQWQGERTRMVNRWPDNQELWDEYAEIRREEFKMDGDGSRSTEFYRQNRTEMDKGAEVSWKERYQPDELSALQHAWNLRIRDEAAFFAEYQNDPYADVDESIQQLKSDDVLMRINGYKRRSIPDATQLLTGFIDVQEKALYYAVVAWKEDFTGFVVDYGVWPEQKSHYFRLRDITKTLYKTVGTDELQAALFQGLQQLTDHLSQTYKFDQLAVDANWGESTDTVYSFCEQSQLPILPCHGKYIGASTKPMSEYKRSRKRGERMGLNWMISNSERANVRHIVFDTNYWKSFTVGRLFVPVGGRGSLSVYEDKPHKHRLFADQLASEYRVRTEGRGRLVDEWKWRPDKFDNHWFDCLVGSTMLASISGAKLDEHKGGKKVVRGTKNAVGIG